MPPKSPFAPRKRRFRRGAQVDKQPAGEGSRASGHLPGLPTAIAGPQSFRSRRPLLVCARHAPPAADAVPTCRGRRLQRLHANRARHARTLAENAAETWISLPLESTGGREDLFQKPLRTHFHAARRREPAPRKSSIDRNRPSGRAADHIEKTIFSNPANDAARADTRPRPEILPAGGRQIGEIEIIARRIKRLLIDGEMGKVNKGGEGGAIPRATRRRRRDRRSSFATAISWPRFGERKIFRSTFGIPVFYWNAPQPATARCRRW